MKFRTEYTPDKASFILSPDRPVVFVGSCFAENMASRMRRCLWDASNPLGVLYNPLSIENALRALLFSENSMKIFNESLFSDGTKYRSWLFDSKMSALTRRDCRRAFMHASASLHASLKSAAALFVTFGTSWCYYLNERSDYVVANCHKQPSQIFNRQFLHPGDCISTWVKLADDLHRQYPDLKIVFTVSPVRHLKDGFAGNARSKAALLLAIDEICRQREFCSYFPAFEILNDDLRDYRFYAADLLHPSEEAVEYIWEIFRATYADAKGESVIKEGEKILKAWNHRPLPDATQTSDGSTEDYDSRYKEQRAATRLRHAVFRNIHPAILPLPE